MPADSIICGPFAEIYVGDYSSSAPLTALGLNRMNGGFFSFEVPSVYLDCVDNEVQAGRPTAQMIITIASDHPYAVAMANGNSLSASFPDQPSEYNLYTVVFLHYNTTGSHSFYFPKCYTKKSFHFNAEQRNITNTPITFIATNRTLFTNSTGEAQRYYMRDQSEIQTLLGSRSPW